MLSVATVLKPISAMFSSDLEDILMASLPLTGAVFQYYMKLLRLVNERNRLSSYACAKFGLWENNIRSVI